MMAANIQPRTIEFRRPAAASASEEATIFPPTIYTNATYSRGILIPNISTNGPVVDGNNIEQVSVQIPSCYFTSSHSLPSLTSQEATNWNHNIAAHASSRRRPPFEIGRLLGTITLFFEDETKKKSESLHVLATKYYGKYSSQSRKCGKKEGDKFKALTLKQALVDAICEAGLEEDTVITTLPPETQNALQTRSQQIFDYWKRIRDSPALHECWHKRDGGFIPQSLGRVITKSENDEFYISIATLMQWLDHKDVKDLAADRVKSLYGGLRHVNTDATSILESLLDLSCPSSLYKIPLITPYTVAARSVVNGKVTWKVRIGVYMNRLLPEILTQKNLHIIMSALDEDSYIVSQPLHLPPMRDSNDPVFASAKYPIVEMPVEDLEDATDEDKKEDDADHAMLGSTRDTKTISPYSPRGLLKLLENTGNVTTGFPEIARALAPYLKLDLMLHQQHAICWMRQMEQLPGFGINSIIWEEREFLDGNKYYYSPALGQIRLNRPPVTAGGCVADEMGLGKTIQMLSLIACSLEELKTEARANRGAQSTHATLIVVPPALVAQWVAEVTKCCGDTLSVNVLDVKDEDFLSRDLVDTGGNGNDVLVTTYSSLENIKTSRYLASWKWGRIVLDEQQEIRSSTTKIAKNCESLDCHRRWMLSGTPIFEGIEDLRGELNFLRLTPYAARWEDGFFDFSIMSHWKHHSEHGIETLRILGLLILRRSKDMTICRSGMPIMNQKKLTVELVPVAQSDSERALYCWFEYLVSQEISGDEKSAKQNLQSRDLCLRLLREICFSAVLINGGLGAASQMRNLNSMYRRLLLRGAEDKDDKDNDEHRNKRPGAIKVMSPIQALSYLSQAERAANVGTDFVSEQTFAGGQGTSSRTYASDSIEMQIESIREKVDQGTRKEAEARQRRAKAHWHLALELITTGALNNDKEVLARVSPTISSLWKWRHSCDKETARGWRPTSRFVQDLQKKFAWADPTALGLVNIPSQVTSDEISTALFDSARQELKIKAKLTGLNTSLSKTKNDVAKARIQQEISETKALLPQAIADDKYLQAPLVTAVKVSNADNKWIAYVNARDEKLLEQLIRQARSKSGIAIKSKKTVPYIQEAIENATQKMKQAEAAFTVHPSMKNKEDRLKAQKELGEIHNGLSIKFDPNFVPASTVHVTMSQAARNRGLAPKSKTALCQSTSASIALANEMLGMVLPRLENDRSTLDRLMRILEKKGDRPNFLTQRSAFDTLEALRTKNFDDTFCPICQLPFGENAADDPNENPLAAMISCGHFFCIKCIDQHIQNEISHYRLLTCPCCRKGFSQTHDVIHIDHLATDHQEVAVKKADAKRKVIEASEILATSDGVLEGELWKHLYWSIDMPTHVSNAPHRQHTALPQDVLAHFRAATGMQIDCARPDTPISWTSKESKDERDNSGLSSKIQTLLRDLPLGERAVVFSSSKEGVLHLTSVIKACGIDCFSLYVGAASNATERWSALKLDPTKAGPCLVVQAGAAASGLTLTAASKIFLMEPFNRQEEEQQAYARCHRYGQTQDVHVKVYYAPVSVESRLLRWRKRSAEKFAPASNGPNYVFTELYDESEEEDGETSDNRVSLGEDCSDEEPDDDSDEKENAENHEENLRTQFLLGLVDEHGNPVGGETETEGHQHAVERPISGRRFILG